LALRLQHVQEVVRGAGSGQLFLVYVMLHGAVAALGYALAAPGMFFTAFWPAAGLLLAACIVLRSEQRWIVLVASIVAEAAIRSLRARSGYSSAGPGVILYVAVVQAVVCGSATMLVERWWRVPLPAGLSKVVRATGVIVLVVTALIAAGAAGLAWYVGRPYPLVLQIWLMSAMLGMIAVTPGILAWWISLAGFAARLDGSRTEFALLFLLTLTATFVVFGDWPDTARYQLLYIHFPLLLWAAMRFPPRYVALIGLAVACMAAGLTSSGQGPFAPANDVFLATLLPMQLFIIAMLSSALLLGVANYERRRSESSLRSYAHALANAEERVRRKTAADLHDGIGQELFGMRMRLEAARRRVTDPSTARLLDENLDTLDDIEKNTRELVQELDPPWIQSLDLDEAVP
jgi:integral membrane sensor domain MASE1